MGIDEELLARILSCGDEDARGSRTHCASRVVDRLLLRVEPPKDLALRERAIMAGLALVPPDAGKELLTRLAEALAKPDDNGAAARVPLASWLSVSIPPEVFQPDGASAETWRDAIEVILDSKRGPFQLARTVVRIVKELRRRAVEREFLRALDAGDRVPGRGLDGWLVRVAAALLDPLGTGPGCVARAHVVTSGPHGADTLRAWVLHTLAPDDLTLFDVAGACSDRAYLRAFARVAFSLDPERRDRLAGLLAPLFQRRSAHGELGEEELALWALVDRDEAFAFARAFHDGAVHDGPFSHELNERYCVSLTPAEQAIVDELGEALGYGGDKSLTRSVHHYEDPKLDGEEARPQPSLATHDARASDELLARTWTARATVVCDGFVPLPIDMGVVANELDITVKELWSAIDETCEVRFEVDPQAKVDWGRTATEFLQASLAGSSDRDVRRTIAAELVRRDEPVVVRRSMFRDTGVIDAIASVTTVENLATGLARVPFSMETDASLLAHWLVAAQPWINRVPPGAWRSPLRFIGHLDPRARARTWGEGLGRVWLCDLLRRCAQHLHDDGDDKVAVLALEQLVNSAAWLTAGECRIIEEVAVSLAKAAELGRSIDSDARRVLADALALGAKVEVSLVKLRQAAWLEELREPAPRPERSWPRPTRLMSARSIGRRWQGWAPSVLLDDDEE